MLLTDDQLRDRIEKIKLVKANLEVDPLALGLTYFVRKIAELQSYKDMVSQLLLEAAQNKIEAKISLEDSAKELDMQISSLLATDEEVKGQKNSELRTSLASVKSANLEMNKHKATLDFVKADSYCSIVQQVYTNIDSASKSLSQQLSVVQMLYESGYAMSDLSKPTQQEQKTEEK